MKPLETDLDSKIIASTQPVVKKRSSREKQKDLFWAYLMITPTLLGLAVFYMWPILQTFYFSFTKWGAFGKYKWIGLENYLKMLHDPDLWMALKNTFIYTILSVPISIFLSIIIAVLLNQKIKGVSIYRALYFLPVVTMPTAISMVWQWLYNGDYGLINYILSLFSIHGLRWIVNPDIALYSLVLVAIWSSLGYNMVIFLSGLQGISSSYYEAASLEGAGPYVKFFKITLPLLSPSIFFVSIISLINSLQVFDLIYMMIGPKSIAIESTQSVVYLFYKNAFLINNKGYAASIAVLLVLITLVSTLLQTRMQKKWVHYE